MIIKLTQGQETIVDDIDYHGILTKKWHAQKRNDYTGKFCAARNEWVDGKCNTILMHRVIAERMGLDMRGEIDHEDRDSLNNLRNNLRAATRTENSKNKSKLVNNTSGITGVYWKKLNQKWCAQIGVNGKKIYLGLFNNKLEAEKVYKEASIKYYKEFSPFYQEIN